MTDSAAADAPASPRRRSLWARLRGRARDDVRDCGEPWMLGFGLAGADPSEPAAPERPETHDPLRERVLVGRDADDHAAWAPEAFREEPAAAPPVEPAAGPEAPTDDRTLVDALYRVADAFERVADSIDADRRARRATLDDVDSLLRTLVGELRSPAAVAPVVLAGTIDAADRATIDLAAVDRVDHRDPREPERRPFERARRA